MADTAWLTVVLDAFPWGAWPRDAAVDTRKQAGRQSTALTGASSRSCCGLFLGNSTVPLVSRKSQNTTNLFCAGSLDGAPIITQSRRHKPCSKIEVSYSAHSQLAFDASLLFTDCQRDCDCDLRLARCCAAAVRSHNTTPPLRPRRGLTHLGGRHNVECRAGPENIFFGPRHVLATEA